MLLLQLWLLSTEDFDTRVDKLREQPKQLAYEGLGLQEVTSASLLTYLLLHNSGFIDNNGSNIGLGNSSENARHQRRQNGDGHRLQERRVYALLKPRIWLDDWMWWV